MHPIMQMLHEDHVNVARLLDLMDVVFEQVRQGDPGELHLVHKAMRYMTAYPDIYHHPTEDVVFGRLAQKAPETRAVVNRLQEEHLVIGKAGSELLTAVRITLEEENVPPAMPDQGADYIRQLQSHMNTEEGEVFPLIKVILREHDWDSIDQAIATGGDPLFGARVQKSYQDLARNLGSRRRQGGTE